MPLPQPPRGDPLDEAILAFAESGARLAACLRGAPAERPQLTLCPVARCGLAAAMAAALYCYWARTYHCAWTWHFAFEIHPAYRAVHWGAAAGASIIWQLWDRLPPKARLWLAI